jgi:hypothetical protein
MFPRIQPERIDAVNRIPADVLVGLIRLVDERINADELSRGGVVVAPYLRLATSEDFAQQSR